MMKIKCLSILICLFCCQLTIVHSQIHRAKNTNAYQLKYDLNFTKLIGDRLSLNENTKTNAKNNYYTWLFSIVGVLLVGFSGVIPLIILPRLADNHDELLNKVLFKCLLAFAAGSLVGDVFIHLLPETYTDFVLSDFSNSVPIGLWSIFGLLSFMIIEKICGEDEEKENEDDKHVSHENKKGFHIKIMGLLNLFANIIDNFTHGIAVAGSFQASYKFGIMTLIATLLHEIPHEIGDFVILLKSGLGYGQAALAQLITAFAGIIGAIFALGFSSAEEAGNVTSWILPFTSGGFLYISLVGIIPDLVRENDARISIKQITSFILGIVIIFLLSLVFD